MDRPRDELEIPFLKCCLHKNEIPVVKVMFEEREEATPKHVSLQQWQLTVCKQAEEIWEIEENRESENIS